MHSVIIESDDSNESSSVIANVQMSQEIASEGSDDECPILINEKALQESIEEGDNELSDNVAILLTIWLFHICLFKIYYLQSENTHSMNEFESSETSENELDDVMCQKNEGELDDSFADDVLWSDHETGLYRPIYRCKICGRAYAHKRPLLAHEKTHITGRPYQCPICTKCFARQVNFNIHMKLHASGRRYFCSLCGKWFRTQSLMTEHQQKCFALMNGLPVLTDRPLRYRCYYCDKMFYHRRDKNIHERTHTGERPYTCGYCSKGFTQSQALTIHIRSHTGERPFSCSICSKEFRDSSALRKHEFTKHVNENLPGDDYSGSSNEIALVTTPYVN
ncbi:unnamed protein product [Acanthocheilonema viteae]|uniref:C2H2-type domain-containing protein n=1 Tax=Acanthocheilonema viteae TaxID=6277 RepID=A0A498SCQ0_ACAVI|nr:unnamed protein product [Acanthocheilonema viteae]